MQNSFGSDDHELVEDDGSGSVPQPTTSRGQLLWRACPSCPAVRCSPSQPLPATTHPLQASADAGQSSFRMPEELIRIPSGASVQTHDSILEATGRTYQSFREGRYFLPNDPVSTHTHIPRDRKEYGEATTHHNTTGRARPTGSSTCLFRARIGGQARSGAARQHPDSHVVGTDLSLIQPANSPPNCEFIKEDSEDEWVFPQYKFDYVHLRVVYTCFNDPRKVMKHAFDNLNEGGWIEYMDFELELTSNTQSVEGSAVGNWAGHAVRGAAAQGRDIKVARHYKDWLVEAGFVDVVEWKFEMPLGTWPRDPRQRLIGDYTRTNAYEGARGIGLKMIAGLGLPPEEIEKIIEGAKHEIKTNISDYEAYFPG
ncbi:hypothetical protein PG997_009389 [Apiospora hydei]|uniref:Methyltransferase n=1 Tax=Apiospora hydei TaxID=1337664 RepID=A0ABR1VTZ6_9PEZI